LAQHVMQLKEKDPKAGSAIEKDLNAFFEQAAQAANEQATESNGEAIPTEMANAPSVQSEQRIPQPPGMVWCRYGSTPDFLQLNNGPEIK